MRIDERRQHPTFRDRPAYGNEDGPSVQKTQPSEFLLDLRLVAIDLRRCSIDADAVQLPDVNDGPHLGIARELDLLAAGERIAVDGRGDACLRDAPGQAEKEEGIEELWAREMHGTTGLSDDEAEGCGRCNGRAPGTLVIEGKIKMQRGYWDKATWFGQVGIGGDFEDSQRMSHVKICPYPLISCGMDGFTRNLYRPSISLACAVLSPGNEIVCE